MRKMSMLLVILCMLFAAGCAMPTNHVQAPEQTLPAAETEETKLETTPPEASLPEETLPVAEKIAEGYIITVDDTDVTELLCAKDYYKANAVNPEQKLAITSEAPFGALYLKWFTYPGPVTLVWEGGSMDCGAEGYLNDYICLPEEITAVEFIFMGTEDAEVSEISLYTRGTAPEGIQDWQEPCDTADILVFPTHSDDDVLFFGGVISHYAIEKGLTVQTAFMTDHVYAPIRNNERLDGLWELGVHCYPVVGTAMDYSAKSIAEAHVAHRNDDILGWQVEQIRRFRPLVILGHDLKGEYGHAQHILNAQYLVQAVELAADPEQYPESARKYGTWATPKLYLHLYEENPLLFDVNTPLEKDPAGRTPMAIAEAAYRYHGSQKSCTFAVTQNPGSPLACNRFGLYRTLVGYDTGADMMEHIDPETWRR